MGIYRDGLMVDLDRGALAAAFAAPGRRLCVFIHGLAFDEHCWQPTGEGEVDFASGVQADFGYTPLFLRYNTGLPIADNGTRLAGLLEELLAAWPEPVEELLLIGHSMGGLIARNACEVRPPPDDLRLAAGDPHAGLPGLAAPRLAARAPRARREHRLASA